MYKLRDFIKSGAAVYGLVGALIGAILGMAGAGILAMPSFFISLAEPLLSAVALAILPLGVIVGALICGFLGILIGIVRGATIHYSLIPKRGWVVFFLAVLLAVLFGDIVSGLALFLAWRAYRSVDLSNPANTRFLRVLRSYIFSYGLILLFLGTVVGSGAGALFASLFNTAPASNISGMNEMVAQLAQFLNSFSFQTSIDTIRGTIDIGANAVVDKDINYITLDSFMNISNINEKVLGYSGSLSSEVYNFVDSIKGSINLDRFNGSEVIIFSGDSLRSLLEGNSYVDIIAVAVNGGMLGAAQGFAFGIIFAIILALMDHSLVRQVINTSKPRPLANMNFPSAGGGTDERPSKGAHLSVTSAEMEELEKLENIDKLIQPPQDSLPTDTGEKEKRKGGRKSKYQAG